MSRHTADNQTIVVEACVIDNDVDESSNDGTQGTAEHDYVQGNKDAAAKKARGVKQMIAGGVIAAAGVPMLILPGPGIAAIAGGIALAGRGYQNATGNDPISDEVRQDPNFERGQQAGEEFVERMRDFATEDLAPAGARVAADLKDAGAAAASSIKDAAGVAAHVGGRGVRAVVGDEAADKAAGFARKNIAPAADAVASFGRGVVASIKPHAAKAAEAGSKAAAAAGQKLADKARDMMR